MKSRVASLAALMCAGTLSMGGFATAAAPTQADIDACNNEAAAATGQRINTPGSRSTGPMITSSKSEAEQATGVPAPANPAGPGSNPTGGRVTDSSEPGAAAKGSSNQKSSEYRAAYEQCLARRAR
jgi:hypothetical protein